VPRNPSRQVVIILTGDEWRCLARQAVAAERDPYQQARWILVQHLAATTRQEAEPAEVAS